jgi:hypothetical protein
MILIKYFFHEGGTMVWITGARFAPNAFSTSPSTATSNQVVITNDFSSYPCEIHPDATTQTQITCFTQYFKINFQVIL